VIDRFLRRLLRIPYSPFLLLVVPPIIGVVRALEEDLLFGLGTATTTTVLEFGFSYLVLLLLLAAAFRIASGRDVRELVGAAAVGLVIAWLPPLLDLLLPRGPDFRYFYLRSFEWDFAAPYEPLGETVTIWLALAVATAFLGWLTRSGRRTLLGAALVYVSLQVFGWVVHAGAAALAESADLRPPMVDPVSLLLVAFAVYAALNARTLGPSLRRVGHALPWGLAAALGARLAGGSWAEATFKAVVMAFAFLLVLLANDYFDREQDAAAGGRARAASGDDAVFAFGLQAALSAWALLHYKHGGFLIVLFFLAANAYHLPALRFKRLFCLGYKIEGVCGMACFLFGLQDAHGYPPGPRTALLALLALGGFSLGSMFKDYKDIDQDRAARVGTIYTLFLARGRSLAGIHAFVRISLTLALLVPAVWLAALGQPTLAWLPVALAAPVPAIFLGAFADRRVAVESALWALAFHLLLFVRAAPALV
jgi:hypothetical protein